MALGDPGGFLPFPSGFQGVQKLLWNCSRYIGFIGQIFIAALK